MVELNRAKISAKLYKQLDRKGLLKSIKIFRCGLNAFKEKVDDLYVCTIKGYYYRNNLKLTINHNESASLNSGYEDKLLVMYNDESKIIKSDDYFVLDDTKFKVVDLGNLENIVLDMSIERV